MFTFKEALLMIALIAINRSLSLQCAFECLR